jgi:hypothetical protein
VIDTLRELVDDLGARAQLAAIGSSDAASQPNVTPTNDLSVVCLPARDEADEIAGMMLAQLLEVRGVKTQLLSSKILVGEMLTDVADQNPRVVCVSALPPFATTHARYLCKRLRPRFPELPIVVAQWTVTGNTKTIQERLAALDIQNFVTTLADATEQIMRLAALHRPMPANAQLLTTPPPVSETLQG